MFGYDIETYNFSGEIIPFCVSLGENNDDIVSFYSDKCVEESIEYLINLKKNIILYIHNIEFDGYLIFRFLDVDSYNCESLIIDNKIYMIKLKSIYGFCVE